MTDESRDWVTAVETCGTTAILPQMLTYKGKSIQRDRIKGIEYSPPWLKIVSIRLRETPSAITEAKTNSGTSCWQSTFGMYFMYERGEVLYSCGIAAQSR